MRRAKITIVGAGNVGATTAHWCAAAELGDIVLLGHSADRATCPRARRSTCCRRRRSWASIRTSSARPTTKTPHGSDVVVITAGIPRKPGMSRDDLLVDQRQDHDRRLRADSQRPASTRS